jgi:hypothetical protein
MCASTYLIFLFMFWPKTEIKSLAYNVSNLTLSYKVILVTYAQNDPFVSSQKKIIETQQGWSVDEIQSWNYEKIQNYFPQYHSQWKHPGKNGRPSCVFFKPVLMSSIMSQYNDGDWIVWVDSSKYFVNGITESMKSFVSALEKLKLDSFPGTALCGLANVDNKCVSIKTFNGMKADVPKYWFAPHFQNNFVAFKKNSMNLNFLNEWRTIMTDMDMACSSGSDDQAIFSILVTKFNMKFLNLCNFRHGLNNPDYQSLKDVDMVIKSVSDMNTSHVMNNQEEFISLWRGLGWMPFDCNMKETLGYYSHRQFALQT